jgi:hypothetical protein
LHPCYGHTLMMAAMIGFYITDPHARDPRVRVVCERLERGISDFLAPVLAVMRLRRAAARLGHRHKLRLYAGRVQM